MAMLLCEGFDRFSALSELSTNGYATNPQNFSLSTSTRFGAGKCLFVSGISAYLTASFTPGSNTLIAGFAIKPSTMDRDYQHIYIGGNAFLGLDPSTKSRFNVYDSTTGYLTSTKNGSCLLGAWNTIEIKIVAGTTTGSIEIRSNGNPVPDVQLTNINTGAAIGNYITFYSAVSSTVDYYIDDLYIMDSTGATCNTFLGDARITTLMPTGDSSVQFTRSGGSTNYENVDEIGNDGDTTYVSSSTAGHQDLFTFGSLPASAATVHAIKTSALGRKDDAGTRQLKMLVKAGGTTYAGSNNNLSTSYGLAKEYWEVNPNTSSAWSVSDVNSLIAGFENV